MYLAACNDQREACVMLILSYSKVTYYYSDKRFDCIDACTDHQLQ